MITFISDPGYPDPLDLSIISRWVATESPNNFRLLRQDWLVTGANNGGFLELTCTDDYTGIVTNDIAVYCAATNQMYIGTVTNIDGTFKIVTTDIVWVATMNITYMNDNTLHGGYYFEGRLTINNVLYPLTIISSPDSFGYADLDVSGLLRIVTTTGKIGDYSTTLMKETTKSGKFNFEYRECWYGSSNAWEGSVITSPVTSPPILIDWYYAECVRSEEQGSNLHDYVANDVRDAPFLNQFDEPVYFNGLPFDISFILPEQALVSPLSDITVTIRCYNSLNTLLSTTIIIVPADQLEGYVNSLNIDPAIIFPGSSHLTAEITV
jgi:hypothetical protein